MISKVNDLPGYTRNNGMLLGFWNEGMLSSDELIQLKDWCDANKIQINPNKSCILHLPPKQNTPPLTFQILYDSSFIVNSIWSKYLGILIDSKLNFKQHIQLVESIIGKSVVGILNKLRHIFPCSALLIYFTLVHLHLLYGLPIWGSTFPTYLQKLQCLQNKALCIISNCNPKGPFPLRAWKKAFFVCFIDFFLCSLQF